LGPKPPNVHPASTRASAKPTCWQVRTTRSSPPTGVQALGPRLCQRSHQSRRTSCCRQPATRAARGRGDARGCIGWSRRPVSAKWVAQAHSHVFEPVGTRSHRRQPIGACLATCLGLLSDKPDGTTPYAQMTNTCLPSGERPNKTPIFITCVSDVCAFLAWLQASCPGGLTAQLKGEKLMVVPSTADRFRAAVSALRSLDGREGVSFHTFTLPEDHCVRLLVKNLGKGMLESFVREQIESLNVRIQGVRHQRSGRRDLDPAKDRPSNPRFIVSVVRGP